MLHKNCRAACALLLAVLLTLSVSVTGFAAQPHVDPGKTGSITVSLSKNGSETTVSGGKVCLHKVADAVLDGYRLTYALTPEFRPSGADLADLRAEGLAAHLSAFAQENRLPGQTKAVDEQGRVTFSGLSMGLYLLSNPVAPRGCRPFTPFLVAMPMTSSDGTGWLYEVDASPKLEVKPGGGGGGGEGQTTELTAKKVWDGATSDQPDSITVNLLKDGVIVETAVLNKDNGWAHTWTGLDAEARWSAAESRVPEGYEVHYSTDGTTVTITNTAEKPDEQFQELTVKKVWADDGKTPIPQSITIELLRDGQVYDTVTLTADGGWVCKWTDLPMEGQWSIREINVPEGYTVSYATDGPVVTVTNTRPLVQTGQLNWPVPLMAVSGLVLLGLGLALCRRRNEHEA